MLTTPGQLLVNSVLPEEYRDHTRTLGQDEVDALMQRIALEHPEKYREISHALVQLGRNAAFDEGSTITLDDLVPVVDKKPLLDLVRKQEAAIRKDRRLTDEQKDDAISTLYGEATKRITEETYKAAIGNNNPFAVQVKYRARGSKNALGAMLTSPGTYTDSNGKLVPIFISRSYAEGLAPHEYWAAGYGARLGVISTKLGTQKGGYLDKMMNAAAIDQVVTTDDCGTSNGIPVSVDDQDNVGAVLQSPAGGFSAGTVITKQVLDQIREKGEDEIVIRSPITCGCKDGLCKKCVGIRENGRFPDIGYNVGVNAASALGERVTQGALNCIVEGTLVRMADGTAKPIEEVNPGDYVLGSDMSGRLSPTRVVARYDNGFQPCVDTAFIINGTRRDSEQIHLLSTTEHPILGTRVVTGQKEEALNWVPRMLKVGTKSREFFAYGPSSFDDTGFRSEPLAMLLGALVGDGCYTESVSGVYLSCADKQEISDLQESISGLGLRLHRLKYHDGIYYQVSGSSARAGRAGNPVKNYLIKHGMYGKYAHDKDVPPDIRTWDNASIAAFVGGFVAADGSIYQSDRDGKPGIALASTSLPLLKSIRDVMMTRFGILPTAITRTGIAGTRYRKHDQYQYTLTRIDAVERFAAYIRIPGRKNAMLHSMLASYKRGKHYNRTVFRRVSQVPIGIRHVYDLEVSCPEHIYMLDNGLIVHNTKHSGRNDALGSYIGFEGLKNMTTIPKAFDVKASVAGRDGKVTAIEPAPQGGQYVVLDDDRDNRIYVPGNLKPSVKVGDVLEAGDAVSTGMVSPADVVQYKGVGEGRRYFTNRFRQVFKESGYGVNRRNVEVLSRALINNVQVENPDSEGSGLPGDILRYSAWAAGYTPRSDATHGPVDKTALGRYLEQPVLHYTIGTRVTPSVLKSLKRHKIEGLTTNAYPPGVVPHMVSIVDAPAYSGDWMARLGTSYLKERLLEDVQRGGHSELHSTNPVPSMAKGIELGKDIATKGLY